MLWSTAHSALAQSDYHHHHSTSPAARFRPPLAAAAAAAGAAVSASGAIAALAACCTTSASPPPPPSPPDCAGCCASPPGGVPAAPLHAVAVAACSGQYHTMVFLPGTASSVAVRTRAGSFATRYCTNCSIDRTGANSQSRSSSSSPSLSSLPLPLPLPVLVSLPVPSASSLLCRLGLDARGAAAAASTAEEPGRRSALRRFRCRTRRCGFSSGKTQQGMTAKALSAAKQASTIGSVACEKTISVLSALPMFVPSLSWQSDHF